MKKTGKREIVLIFLVLSISYVLLYSAIHGIDMNNLFQMQEKIKTGEIKQDTSFTGYAATTVSATILNAAPEITSINSFSDYNTYNDATSETEFSVCSDTGANTTVYFNLNYTDNNIHKDVSERGNMWFRLRALDADGNYDPEEFDTDYFLGEFETGEDIWGIYKESYPISAANFAVNTLNISISVKIYDGVDTITSTQAEDAIITVSKTTCQAAADPGGPGGGGGTPGGDLPSEEPPGEGLPGEQPPMPDEGPPGEGLPGEQEPLPEEQEPIPEEEIPKKPLDKEIEQEILEKYPKKEEMEDLNKIYKEEIIKEVSEESLQVIKDELKEKIDEIEEEIGIEISEDIEDALEFQLNKKLSESLSLALSDVEKAEQIDEIIENIGEEMKNAISGTPKSNLLGEAIKRITPIKKYEETQKKEVKLVKEEKIKFIIKDERHSIRIKEISGKGIEIIIQSEPMKIELMIGEIKEIDLDGDGEKDIRITLIGIKGSKAEVSIESLEKKMIIESKKTSYKLLNTVSKASDFNFLAYGIILIVYTAILIYVFKLFRKHIKKTVTKTTTGGILEKWHIFKLENYVKKQVVKGISKVHILKKLQDAGWKKEIIEKVIKKTKK